MRNTPVEVAIEPALVVELANVPLTYSRSTEPSNVVARCDHVEVGSAAGPRVSAAGDVRTSPEGRPVSVLE